MCIIFLASSQLTAANPVITVQTNIFYNKGLTTRLMILFSQLHLKYVKINRADVDRIYK